MHAPSIPVQRDLVLIGGGHSHVAVLKGFGMRPLPGVRLTLVSREISAPYSGMLPGLVAGHYTFDEAHIDLAPLARFAGARFFHDEVVGLDPENRVVLCRDHPPVAYDVLSINTGSAPNTRTVPGAGELAIPVKPIDRFLGHWNDLLDRLRAGRGPKVVAVVGGGAGGVELSLALAHRLAGESAAAGEGPIRVHLFTDTDEILPAHNQGVRRRLGRALSGKGVTIHTGRRVESLRDGRLHFRGGGVAPADEVFWTTSAAAPEWPGSAGLPVTEDGFIQVRDTLQTLSHPEIFAAGDVAHVVQHPRPKSGVFAVRQGPPLERNLKRLLLGREPARFRPQRRFLSLISTGDRSAVASWGPVALEGPWVWRWKDSIDRRFMERYNDLPEMAPKPPARPRREQDGLTALATPVMRCGGCGAKVGSAVLSRALERLGAGRPPELLIGLDAPDDAAVLTVPEGRVVLQSVDFFRSFVEDPWIFGRVAATHALGDIYAMGGEPRFALAVVTLPLAAEAKMEEDLFQLLAGATAVFDDEGVALAGGHTGEGSELALGFAVTGFVSPDAVKSKGGLRPGDRLILTKPLGTGALFAAHMRGRARGRWISAALEVMTRSSRAAAAILAAHEAKGITDVTGFGLLGHLLEMVEASGVGVDLDLERVPLLDGALEVAARGIFSSLQPQNVRLRRAVEVGEAAEDPRFAFLFDPQTAGGLLGGVPANRSEACVAALRLAGYPDAVSIGRVREAGSAPEPIRVLRGAPRDGA